METTSELRLQNTIPAGVPEPGVETDKSHPNGSISMETTSEAHHFSTPLIYLPRIALRGCAFRCRKNVIDLKQLLCREFKVE